MTIQEAIKHSREKARQLGNCECAKEHIQLAEWLEELLTLRNLNNTTMTQNEYFKKRKECWDMTLEKYGTEYSITEAPWDFIFSYAYEFGKSVGLQDRTSNAMEKGTATCSAEKLRKIYAYNEGILWTDPKHSGALLLKKKLRELFGDQCQAAEIANKAASKTLKVGDKCVFHPFKSDDFINAVILEIEKGEDKPYLLSFGDNERIWAYPIEVQTFAETYPAKLKSSEPTRKETKENANTFASADLKPSNSGELKSQEVENERLKIASMAMQGILANSASQMIKMDVGAVVDLALCIADALISAVREADTDIAATTKGGSE